jgi:hypothetical protein
LHTKALIHLAVAMAQAADGRADATFLSAQQMALAIPPGRTHDMIFLELIKALVKVQRTQLAETMLSKLQDDRERQSAIQEIVRGWIEMHQLADAVRVARLDTNAYSRRPVLRDVAIEFAHAGQVVEGIKLLEEDTIDSYLESLSMVIAAWTAGSQKDRLQAIYSATRIAGWVRTDWREIHELLLKS